LFNAAVLRCYLIALLAACSLLFFFAETNAGQESVRLSMADLQPLATVHEDHSGLQFVPVPDSLPDDPDEYESAYFDDHSHEGDKLLPAFALQWTQRAAASWVSTYFVAPTADPVFTFERPPKALHA
jgi:hypothetical protein